MATAKFYLTSKKPNSMVYVRFTAGRKLELRRKTGITIPNPVDDWSQPKQMPKTNVEHNKALNTKLKDLSNHILKKYNDAYNNSEETIIVDGDWLGNCIDVFFDRVETSESDYFINYAKKYINDLPNRTLIKNGVKKKYSPKTIEKYEFIIKHFESFETKTKRRFKILDITNDVTDRFVSYLVEEKNQATNTVGREVKRIKTIILDAEKNGFKINPKVKEIKGFEDEKIIVALSFDEIDLIKDTKLENERQERARDWLIIACYTGQRISDLWRMKARMIHEEKDFKYIQFTQYKTGKGVKIPIHSEVEEVLKKYKNNFPPMYSNNEKSNRTILGNLMKEVCKIAGINEMTTARLNGVKGSYEKWKLICNHSCRRSFCCNYYGSEYFTTPMLMEITGHVRESNFLKYIGVEDFKFSERSAIGFAKQQADRQIKKEEEKKKLKVV